MYITDDWALCTGGILQSSTLQRSSTYGGGYARDSTTMFTLGGLRVGGGLAGTPRGEGRSDRSVVAPEDVSIAPAGERSVYVDASMAE